MITVSRRILAIAAAISTLLVLPSAALAAPGGELSGAIFTTDVSGVPVNLNHYAAKQDVYLNGGPGINAPNDAAGLPAGTYTFKVTGPNAKDLLSTDDRSCRQFTVDASGVIQMAIAGPTCTTGAHLMGADGEDGGATIQLFPFDDTKNPGGVYKVTVTPTFRLSCANNLARDCFVPRYSKTDNFKVKANAIVEIDTRFWRPGSSTPLLGMAAGWTDTDGATNVKFSEYDPAMLAFNEAHVEAVEEGTHQVIVENQTGCRIDYVTGPNGERYQNGSGKYVVKVAVAGWNAGDDITYRVEVYCR
jgi:hypothetical protein